MKFEIHTSVITKVVNDKNEAMVQAYRMSLRYGRATVWCDHDKLATYVKGIKK